MIAEEYGRLATAAKLRGFVPATNWHTYRSKAALVAMVLVKSFDRSQRVYQAMVLRGFTGTFPSLDGLSACRRDAVFGMCVIVALAWLWGWNCGGGDMASEAVLELTGISFAYPGAARPVLDGLDFDLRAASALGFTVPTVRARRPCSMC